MKVKILLIFFSIVFIFPHLVYGQSATPVVTPNYPYVHFSVDDGLPQSIIVGMMQDSYGYIWLSTSEGIAKFTGKQFYIYNNNTGYPFRVITGIAEARPGEIWVAAYRGGLWRLIKDKLEKINFDPALKDPKINSLVKTADGEILLCAEPGGFYVFRHDSVVYHLSDRHGLLPGPVSRAAKDNRGRYWIGSYYDGIRVFKGYHQVFTLTTKEGLPSNEIRTIFPFNNEVWIGTNKGLFVYGNADFTRRWEKLFPDAFIASVYSNNNRDLWINLSSKPGGLVHLRNHKIVEILKPTEPFFSKCTLVDRSKALFIGSYQGLYIYPDLNFSNFGHKSGLTDIYIKAINKDCNGNLLVATRSDGLFRLEGHHFVHIDAADTIFNGNAINDFKPFNHQLWVGTARGLYVFKDNRSVKKPFSDFFLGKTIRRLEIIDGHLFLLTRNHIYRLLDNDSLKEESYNLKHKDISLWGINKDKNDNFFVITNGQGIWKLKDTTWVQIKNPFGIRKVLALRKDKQGNLYFATAKGAYKWDGSQFSPVLELRQTVWDILPTQENGIWLLTSRGLYQVKGNFVKIYNKQKGILTSEFNMGAVFYVNDNDFWFGGVEGLVHFYKKIQYPEGEPPLYIASITSKDTTLIYPFRKKIVFSASNRSIKIRFHQINFGTYPDFAFAYWLEGLNHDTLFVQSNEIDFVNYTNLSDGVYTFHLFLVNPITHYIAKESTLSFIILPPWWKSIWFMVLVIIVFALFVGLIVRWRVAVLERRNLLLEKQVEERTHDIQLSYKLLKKETEERKKAEGSLFKEREQLAITLRSIADGVIRTDLEGNIQLINASAEEILNASMEKIVGKNLNDIIELRKEETNETIKLPEYIRQFADQNLNISYFNAVLKPKDTNTEKIVNISWSYVKDEKQNNTGYVWVFRDISTERKLESEMMRSQKLESIGLLAGGIAHDFNNILSGILGNAQLAQLALSAKKGIEKYLKGIIEAAQNATRLTQQLLTFAKGGEPVKEILDLKKLLSDSVEFALRGSSVACSYDIDENLWAVEADKGQLNQVINNLVINALQAMPGGGKLRVSAKNYEYDGSEKELAELSGNYFVKISFSDTGHGIPKENLQKIFDPYFTTKQRGSGLGLATTYAIIKKHGGRITVDSQLGEGTTFSIYLPAIPNSKINEKEEKETLISWQGKRALVMDDEEYIRDLMGSFLEMLGIESDFAQNGEEAIQKYKQALQTGKPFDVVIMDLTIRGGMGGKEAVKKILEIDAKAKVIVASGYSTDSVLANSEGYGFKGRLSKPFSLEELNKVLNQVLNE